MQRPAVDAPEIPDEIQFGQLDREVRQRLRTLSKDNAEDVGRHLIMAGALIELDPELAYRHAQVALQRGGRVDVVREANALAAYATGRFTEALREFRTVRRLNGSHEYLPLMADCERGLGRPERAIDLARSDDAASLPTAARAELEIVAAGARLDLGDAEAALVALRRITVTDEAQRIRVDEASVPVLRALGRDSDADELESRLEIVDDDGEVEFDVTVYDVAELSVPVDEPEPAQEDGLSPDGADASEDDGDPRHVTAVEEAGQTSQRAERADAPAAQRTGGDETSEQSDESKEGDR
ncbi:hypothetical protein [Demequina aestuarii]|uniref:hypothetical protein n=1 Tax=Demequina aestuarii TaxID=327095 RepID=UPI00128DB9D2|nr:hypothetical protein [Demequina aestuarii]